MTKAEWKSYIYNHLQKIDETSRYHPVVIEKTIDTVYGQMFTEEYARNRRGVYKYTRTYTDTLSSTYDPMDPVPITKKPITLDRVNGGVFDVALEVSSVAVKAELTGLDLLKRDNEDRYDTMGVPSRRLVAYAGDSLYVNVALASNDDVTYTIIPKFSSLSDTDEVLLPIGAEEVLADRVLDTMRLVPPVDLMNDNA
jgi:hypothetical protein